MPAVLVITRDRVQLEKVDVTTTPFQIGRSSQCHLTLPDNMLSQVHCEIARSGLDYTLEDKGSRNGTLLNGAPVAGPTPLKDGDKIGIGPFEVTFFGQSDLAPAVSEDYEEEAATRFAGAEDISSALKRPDKEKPKKAEAMSSASTFKIEITNGPMKGTVEKNWKGDLRFGRGSENNIIIPDDALSSYHARISRDPTSGRNFVEDLDSANGTFVDNNRIREKTTLKNGSKIRIGTTVIEYAEVDPAQKRKMQIRLAGVVLLMLMAAAAYVALQPEDLTVKFLSQADAAMAKGQYADAIAAYERALAESPGNQQARQGINSAKSRMEAEQFLQEARQAAIEERYKEALDICHRVLRLFPNNAEAAELKEVVTMVEEAQVAMDHKNWRDAILLIEKALEAYPQSEVLISGLERAKYERQAEQDVQEARRLMDEKKFLDARNLLSAIKEGSSSHEEAEALIARTRLLEQAEQAFVAASMAYRNGQQDTALRYIAQGLAKAPDYPDLLALKSDIETVAPLINQLEGSEALLKSEDVAAIRDMILRCESVMNVRTQSEEVGRVKVRAAELAEQLRNRLLSISADAYAKGNEALSAKQETAALGFFTKAAEADPGNESAAQAMEFLRKKIQPKIEQHYRQAKVHEDLGQIDLAINEYEMVLQVAVPGDDYYERAKRRIKRLKM